MVNVFRYLDYREFLEDFYREKKMLNPHFSFQVFAAAAGFRSKSFIKLVIDGKKNLTSASMEKINRALKLADKPFSYFKDCVEFNQANTLQLRNFYFEKLLSYNKRSNARVMLQDQYDFYVKWYHNTVRELACARNFKGDFEMLGRMIRPAISARKARQSVELLEKLGLIRRTGAGGYAQSDAIITTGPEVRSLAVQNFHQQNLFIAGQSIETVPSSEREISCLVLGLSAEGADRIKGEIQKFQARLLKIAEHEKSVHRVYHCNFQLFPTSEPINDTR